MKILSSIPPGPLLAATLWLGPGVAALHAQDPSTATVTEFTVGGLKVLVKPRPSVQSVSVGIFFTGGRASQPAGIENLLLETATEGSEHFPRDVMRAEQARLAMSLGSGINRDYSVVSMICTRAVFDRAFEIMVDVVMRPALQAADFAQVRARQVAAAGSAEAAADSQLRHLVEGRIYEGHPYARRGDGTRESLAAISLPELRAYHRELLQAANMRVVIVGQVDPADIRRKVKAAFAGLPPGDSPEEGVPLLKFSAPSFQRTARDLPTTYVEGVFAAPAMDGADMPAYRLLISLLHDRIFAQVRTKHALSYAPGAGLELMAAGYGTVYFTTGKVDEAARLCLAEVSRLKRYPVTVAELKNLCTQLRVKQYLNLETNASQAGQLIQAELIGGGWKNALVTSYDSVTPADIQQSAQKWLNNFQFFLLGPAGAKIDEAAFREMPDPVIAK